MHNEHHVTLSGEITDIFAHRFVVRTAQGTILADLGPKGADAVTIAPGDHVELTGEQKPSEVKVSRLTANGQTVAIEHGRKDHPEARDDNPAPVDPAAAVAAVEAKGFQLAGEPRRKPKHFEILAKEPDGRLTEFHVEFDGAIRKSKPVDDVGGKWAGAAE